MSDNSGPAFPSHASLGNLSTGMTLRNWFAGQALAGLLASGIHKDEPVEEIAYQKADKMIAEGEKGI